jgi:hypothetical protein
MGAAPSIHPLTLIYDSSAWSRYDGITGYFFFQLYHGQNVPIGVSTIPDVHLPYIRHWAYIGPAIVIGTLAVVGLLVHPTIGDAALAPLLYLAVVTVEGHFLTSTLMGQRLELNPFAVFLAIAFCAWLWGPLGAFLAVPMLMALSVIFGHAFEEEKSALPE